MKSAPITLDSAAASVIVGMLGHGSRAISGEDLVSIARHPNVAKLVIFWNSPSIEMREALDDLQEKISNAIILVSQDNLGSAGGYARLIEYFQNTENSPFLLLLDDDLQPESDCLEQLLATAALHARVLDHSLFLAHRPGLPELADLVSNQIAIRRPRPSCCIGFHIMNFIKPACEPIDRDIETGLYSIGSAPWGGLLIPRQALKKLGSPREDFFLYAEDYELTARFVWGGGKIMLVPNAVIQDKDTAWNAVGGNISGLKRRLLKLPEIKVFYEVRNRNFMARRYYPGWYPVYFLNKYIFLAATYALGMLHRKLSRSRLIHRAINDGEHMATDRLSKDY